MTRREELNDKQWEVIEPLIPQPPRRRDGKGRPRRDDRDVLNGILWILRSGARWQDLPERFPPYQTCHRRLQHRGVRSGVFKRVPEALAEDLRSRGKLDLAECFIDATFVAAKKGGAAVGKTKRGKGTKLMAVWQTALALLSPSTRRLLAHMKSPLLKALSSSASPRLFPNG